MEILIWSGAAVSVVGLAALVWCILRALKAKRAGLPDDVLRARLQKIVLVNMGALFLSVIGLMMIVIGILLG